MRLALWFLAAAAIGQTLPKFEATTLATGLRGGYQVLPVDINNDDRVDLLVLASGMSELFWLENPSWDRHVIAGDMSRMINAAPVDVDDDGIPEIAVASLFENVAAKSVGLVEILTHHGDPKQPWDKKEIDRLTTSHRLRWFGDLLINAPLTGAKAVGPDFRDNVPIVAYRPGDWERVVIDDSLQGVLHGIFVVRGGFLTASFEGIHKFTKKGSGWKKELLTKGNTDPWPKSGSSDVTELKVKRKTLMAAIEPWHGNRVAVYEKNGHEWRRTVIDESLTDGHTIVAADFDRDGVDEIVAGYRGGTRGVLLYQRTKDNTWQRTVLDSGEIAAAACVPVDLDADKRMDIVCIGSATQNLKWYRQLPRR